MFLGYHPTRLKKTNQLPLPANWRSLIAEGAYLTQGFDQNILIMTPGKFEEIVSSIRALNLADPLARLLTRTFFSAACYVERSDADAISLPGNLIDYADLDANVVIVGQGEYVEVWSSGLWQEQETEIHNAKANTERFAAFNISHS